MPQMFLKNTLKQINNLIEELSREEILSKYCKVMEIGNHFWEYEDNCILNNDIDIDIITKYFIKLLKQYIGVLT